MWFYRMIIYFFALALSVSSIANAKIVVATHIEPPFVYQENGQFKGRNVAVAKLLANAIAMPVEFIYCPFARCLNMMKKGDADMMVAINKTAEREEYLHFLHRPFSSVITPVKFFVSGKRELAISNYDALKSLTIGVLRGASYFSEFDKDTSLNKVELTTHKQLIKMLLKGRIDTFLARELSIKTRVSRQVYEHELATTAYVYQKRNDAYIAISKHSSLSNKVVALSNLLDTFLINGDIATLIAQ